MSRKFEPAPDPPTKGLWVDPHDPTKLRYHNGKRWAAKTYSREAWEQQRPQRQGLFLLGAGRDGIPTGEPLAEQKGRYVGRFGIITGILAICGGFASLWIGVNHDLPALGWSGLVVIVAMFGFFGITSWRAGYRPPGSMLLNEPSTRWWFVGWVCLITGVALGTWIAPALDRDSIAYDWTNRIGMVLLNGTVLVVGGCALYAFWHDRHRPETKLLRWLLLPFAFGLPALFLTGTWDRLEDALWLV